MNCFSCDKPLWPILTTRDIYKELLFFKGDTRKIIRFHNKCFEEHVGSHVFFDSLNMEKRCIFCEKTVYKQNRIELYGQGAQAKHRYFLSHVKCFRYHADEETLKTLGV